MAAARPKRYTAYIQSNPRRGVFAGYIPGFGGSETWGDDMDGLKENLRVTLARKLAEKRKQAQSPSKPRPGFHRIDIKL
ncbi:MAG: hypothetical protein AAB152_13600 [Candidatus Coatesbacteria bacterium]